MYIQICHENEAGARDKADVEVQLSDVEVREESVTLMFAYDPSPTIFLHMFRDDISILSEIVERLKVLNKAK